VWLKTKDLELNAFTPEKFRIHITAFSFNHLQIMPRDSKAKISPARVTCICLNISVTFNII
jgi:hypothetical protein